MHDYSAEIIDTKQKILIDEAGARFVHMPRLLRTAEAVGRYIITGTNVLGCVFTSPLTNIEEIAVDSNFAPRTHRYVSGVIFASIITLGIGLSITDEMQQSNHQNIPSDNELSILHS